MGAGRTADSYDPSGAVGALPDLSTDAKGHRLMIESADMAGLDLAAAPRQFAVISRRGDHPPVVVAWGQDFGDGTLMRLHVPGTRIQQIFEHSSAEAALRTLRNLHLGTLALVWTAPTAEGV